MAKTNSKPETKKAKVAKETKVTKKTPSKSAARAKGKAKKPASKRSGWRKLQLKAKGLSNKLKAAYPTKVHLHHSFKRSYREDYLRPATTPGLLSHAVITFQTIFRYWRTFLPFLALMVALYILAVGLMSEEFYQQFQDTIDNSSAEIAGGQIGNFAKAGLLLISTATTGGLNAGMDEVQVVFTVMLFLIIWLVTIYLLRRFLAGDQVRLRDGLYNSLGPLLSTAVIFVIIFIQAIPLLILIIAYSAAVTTNFLATPFYALLFFVFAALMLLISGYLLSSSLIALIAVTAPGIYPLRALGAASDLMAGRRIKFVTRILYALFVVVLIYIVTILPVILIDLWLKNTLGILAGWPIVPFCLLVVTCFIFIYLTTYFYLFYRWLLDYKEQ